MVLVIKNSKYCRNKLNITKMALLSLRYQEWCKKLSSLPYYVMACKFLKVEMINCQIVYNLFFACNLIETALKCITLNGLILQSTGWKDPSIFYNISLNLCFALKELPCELHDNWEHKSRHHFQQKSSYLTIL